MSNSLAKVHPELISQRSDKNLPFTPDDITYGSNKEAWRKGSCTHEWEASVKSRTVRTCLVFMQISNKIIFNVSSTKDNWRLYLQTSTGGSASGLRQRNDVPLESRLLRNLYFL